MSETVRRDIPMVIAFVFGLILIFNWYLPTDMGSGAEDVISSFGVIIAGFAVMIGTIALYLRNIREFNKQVGLERFYTIWTLLILSIWIIVGVGFGERSENYRWMFNNIFAPLSSSTYSSLALFIAAGAYRAFRARTWDSTLLVISGILMLFRNTPLLVATWPPFLTIGQWIMDVVTMSTFRGITIGIGLGSIALGIRTLIGLETGYLGRVRKE